VTLVSDPCLAHPLTGKTVICRREGISPDTFRDSCFPLYQSVNLNYFDLSVQHIVDVAEKWQDCCEFHPTFRSFPHGSPTSILPVINWNARVPLSPPDNEERYGKTLKNTHITPSTKGASNEHQGYPAKTIVRYAPGSSIGICMLTFCERDRYALSYVTAKGEGFLTGWFNPVNDDKGRSSVAVST
jgi:hypothetical protein